MSAHGRNIRSRRGIPKHARHSRSGCRRRLSWRNGRGLSFPLTPPWRGASGGRHSEDLAGRRLVNSCLSQLSGESSSEWCSIHVRSIFCGITIPAYTEHLLCLPDGFRIDTVSIILHPPTRPLTISAIHGVGGLIRVCHESLWKHDGNELIDRSLAMHKDM